MQNDTWHTHNTNSPTLSDTRVKRISHSAFHANGDGNTVQIHENQFKPELFNIILHTAEEACKSITAEYSWNKDHQMKLDKTETDHKEDNGFSYKVNKSIVIRRE